MTLAALENLSGGLWPYLVVVLFGFLPVQFRIIAKVAEDFTHDAAGFQVNRIGLRPVERDLKNPADAAGSDDIRHGTSQYSYSATRTNASTATALSAVTSTGLISISSSVASSNINAPNLAASAATDATSGFALPL